MISITWNTSDTCVLDDRDHIGELLTTLAEIASRSYPFLVHLTHPLGGTLSIGVGLNLSVLCYEKSPGTPPFLVSAGSFESVEYVEFYAGDEPTEFPMWQLIPVKVAYAASLDFCELGHLPDYVRWREV